MEEELTPWQRRGLYITLTSVLLPAMFVALIFPEDLAPWGVAFAVAVVGGAIGGGVYDEARVWPGALGAAVFGACAIVGMPLYVAVRSLLTTWFVSFEFVFPTLLAGLPGLAVYKGLHTVLGPRRA